MSEVTFRPASATEVSAIARLSRDHIEFGLPWSWRAPRLLQCVEDPRSMLLGAFSDNRLLAFCAVRFESTVAHLLLLAVKPRYRRRGIASAFLDRIVNDMRFLEIDLLQVEVRTSNSGAVAFYARHDFEVVARLRGYYYRREDAIRMARRLAVRASDTESKASQRALASVLPWLRGRPSESEIS